jgi:menaquinone-dependent protoporphyrinogen oxidase
LTEKLRDQGHSVDLHDAGDPIDLPFYDAAIIGSSVYYRSWLPEAAEFVRRNIGALARRPTWLFSVGATSRGNAVISGWQGRLAGPDPIEIPVFRQAIHPRDYHFFTAGIPWYFVPLVGARIARAVKGGKLDGRDWQDVDAWAEGIARELAIEDAARARRHEKATAA